MKMVLLHRCTVDTLERTDPTAETHFHPTICHVCPDISAYKDIPYIPTRASPGMWSGENARNPSGYVGGLHDV